MNDHRLDRAVAPNLFDVVADPDLVFTLVLANLMSPRLWAIRDRILEEARPAAGEQGPAHASGIIERIQQFLDHHFEHVSPARVAEMHGVLDLDTLSARYGADAIEYARSRILSTYDWRLKRGNVERDALALDLIAGHKFPAYTYATIDEARACRRLLGRRKHKPLGLTCCLDEAAIFIALLLTTAGESLEDIAIVGSPTHYSVLVSAPEDTLWFYSKHDLISASAWSQLVATAGGDQLAFDDRLPDFDRIIAASGSYSLTTGETSMPEPRLRALVAQIDGFFGRRPGQLERALENPIREAEGSGATQIVRDAASACSDTEVRARIRRAALEQGNVPALRALYGFRALDLPDLSPYLHSARESSHIGALLPGIVTLDDALRAVAAIAGRESIFEDPERIALPDETALFGSGTDRDKALLLHVLLERAPGIAAPAKTDLETLIGATDSFVRSSAFCISVSRMAQVSDVEGRILHRIADA